MILKNIVDKFSPISLKHNLKDLDLKEKTSIVTPDSDFRFYWVLNNDENKFYTTYNPELATLYFQGKPIYSFNSLMDFRAFWDVMCGLEFYKYSKNPNFSINSRTTEEIEKLNGLLEQVLEFRNYPEEVFIEMVLSVHPKIWPDPMNCIKGIVDLYFTPFNEYIVDMLLLKFKNYDPDASPDEIRLNFKNYNETDSPNEFRLKYILWYLECLRNNINKTKYNIFIYDFYLYIKERSYMRERAHFLYRKEPVYTNIELMYSFLYQEDLIEFINCLKITRRIFWEGKVPFVIGKKDYITNDENNIEKYRSTYAKVVEFYFPSLIEKLSELVHYLEKYKN